MKKLLAALLLIFSLSAHAEAAVTPVLPPAVIIPPPAVWTFLGFTAFGSFVVYANATGIDFPLCGKDWMHDPNARGLGGKCFGEYPSDRNGG